MSIGALRLPLAIVLGMVAVGYGGLCAWVYAKQRDFLYFPQFTRVEARDTDFELHRGGVVLRGWVVNPGRPAAILYFGGNAERIEQGRGQFAAWFPDHSVYLLSYRGYGASDGAPREADLLADALALFDDVRTRHAGPIAVVGRSLGSGIASYVASQRPVTRVVLVTPFDSLANVASAHYPWLPMGWLIRDRYESSRYLAGYRGPILLIRAGRDTVIPPANTARLIQGLPNPPLLVVLPAADHNSLDGEPAYREAVVDFLREDMRTTP